MKILASEREAEYAKRLAIEGGIGSFLVS